MKEGKPQRQECQEEEGGKNPPSEVDFFGFYHGKKSSHHVVLVVGVEEGDAVGVEVDGVPLLETLLEAGDAPDGDHQVGREHHQHDRLHPLEGEGVAQLVPGK